MALVYLDAGHGGYDSGATYQGRREKDDNLNLTLAIGELLAQNGVDIGYTRVSDTYDSPVRKAQIANEAGADFFVSLHRNSSQIPNTYSGVQTLLFDESGTKLKMAQEINRELAAAGFNNLGTSVRKDLAVLRRTQMPALLVEAGFINTDADNATFDRNFDEIVYAIANGIYKTLYGTNLPNSGMDGVLTPPITPTPPPSSENKLYYVQTGLFRNYNNAANLTIRLQESGYSPAISITDGYYGVFVGPFKTRAEGQSYADALSRQGYDTLLVLR